MSVNENPFGKIALKVKEAIGDGAEPERLDRHEQMLIALVENRNREKHRRYFLLLPVATALAAAAVIVFVLMMPRSPEALSFTVGNNHAPSQRGAWISSAQDSATDIRFDSGTLFRVDAGSAARVVRSDDEMVDIELSRGTLDASVNGNHRTLWRVSAGPFTVSVLGTKFQVTWNSVQNDLQVNVLRGAVLVQGGRLDTHGVRLTAGSRLATRSHGQDWIVETLSPPRGTAKNEPENEPGPTVETVDSSIDSGVARPDAKPKIDRRPDWFASCRNGDHPACTDAAIEAGIGEILATATLEELWTLAEAARNTGKPGLSNDALVQLRGRFRGTPKAKLAAFIIGRSAMDVSGMNDLAAQWFTTYLKESPSGNMAEEAYGRLMTTYSEMGRQDLAARTADGYLARFPRGLYENRARSMRSSAK